MIAPWDERASGGWRSWTAPPCNFWKSYEPVLLDVDLEGGGAQFRALVAHELDGPLAIVALPEGPVGIGAVGRTRHLQLLLGGVVTFVENEGHRGIGGTYDLGPDVDFGACGDFEFGGFTSDLHLLDGGAGLQLGVGPDGRALGPQQGRP